MYLHHFKLSEKPFQISPDPRFLWLGEKHKEAFANLLYSMIDQNGFLVLTGDVGSGKTTLLNALLENIDKDVLAATISNPRMEVLEMLRYIARAYDPEVRCENKTEFLFHMSRRFREVEAQGKKLLLVIDEAHLLSDDQLEEIRLISNIESSQKKLITIILIGQNELNQKLRSDSCRALRQRISLYYQLQPFTLEETHQYLKHRLSVAGTAEAIFTAGAIDEIQALTGGLPRLINILCARALLTGYARGTHTIGREVVRECGVELHLMEQKAPVFIPAAPKLRNRNATLAAAGLAALAIPAITLLGVKFLTDKPAVGSEPVTAAIADQNPASGSAVQPQAIPASVPEQTGIRASGDSSPKADPKAKDPAREGTLKTGLISRERSESTKAENSQGPEETQGRPSRPDAPEESPTLKTAELPRPPDPSPDTGPTVQTLAQSALEKQNYRYAIELLEPYLAQQPNAPDSIKRIYAQALTGQGRLHLDASRYKEAEESLTKAALNAPGEFQVHFELGKLYTKTKAYDKAIASYRRAIDARPDSAAGLYNLAFVYAGQNDFANAEKMLQRASEQKAPFTDKIYFNLGVVQLKLGKKKEGVLNLKKSLDANPENFRARQYLAQLEK